MVKTQYLLFLLLVLLPCVATAQEDVLRLQPYTVPGTFINEQLVQDSINNGGIPANRVYELRRGSLYLANATYTVNAGQSLRMRANDSLGNRPVIMLYETGLPPNPQNPPGNLIDLRGNLDFKNIILSGYYEPIDTNLNNLGGALITVATAGAGATISLDSCIITNINGNHLRTNGATQWVKITNCIFANMGYLGRSNLGAGKGIDLRDASHDSLIILNSTFVNWQDRVVRHYNFSNPLAGTGPINYLRIEHNTFVNGQSYHGFLSLGSMGPRAIITNNLMVDHFSLGNDSDATRQAEFVNNLEVDPYGGPRMTWIFTTPNDSTQWTIAKNYYVVTPECQSFYDSASILPIIADPPLTVGSPLTYHINSKLGADSVNAFTEISLALNNTPKVMKIANQWYRSPSGGNKLKNTPNAAIWNNSFDFDRRGWRYFNDTLDCAYPTSSPAYTAADGDYPVGDLNWFPARYAAWLNDPVSSVRFGDGFPASFELAQNYPNPFNPVTTITYSVPREAKVKLEVYDLLGRRVATLVDGLQQVGTHSVSFGGSSLASGVYLYRLSAPDQMITRKMVLMK
jgi:Secretion system C-terminal sorting domain